MKIYFNRLLSGLFCLFVLTASLCAQGKAPVELKLVPGGWENGHILAGLLLTIPKDWHVYGPSPQGEDVAGFEPTVTWEKSSNLQKVKILWPVTKKTEIQGQPSYVYEGQALIPLELTPLRGKDPISLKLRSVPIGLLFSLHPH